MLEVNKNIEIWKDINNYEIYQISNLGNVKNKNTNRIIKKCFTIDFYHRVNLVNNLGQKNFRVHRLVANAFITNIYNKETVNHINGIKTDNNIKNLEWATRKEQTEHAMRTGLFNPPPSKKVIDTKTKIIYNSLKDVSILFNINIVTLRSKLNGIRKNNTNYEYIRIRDTE